MRTSRALLIAVALVLTASIYLPTDTHGQSWAWLQNVNIEMKDRDLLSMINEVRVEGNLAYCVLPWGVQIVDITNTAAPVKLGECTAPDIKFPQAPYMHGDVIVHNGFLLVDNLLFDVSVPTAPVFVKEFRLYSDYFALALSGEYLYAVKPGGVVDIYDFTDPANADLLGSWQAVTDLGNETVNDAAVANGYLYLATQFNASMIIVDISMPTVPVTVGEVPMTTPGTHVAVSGQYVGLTRQTNGLFEVFDATDPSAPVSLGEYLTSNYVMKFALDGSRAYCLKGAGELEVVQFTPSGPPTLVSRRQPPTGNPNVGAWNGITVANGMVFLARSDIGLELLTPNGDDLTLTGQYVCNDFLKEVVSDGQYLYVASWRVGLRVLSLADPDRPELIATLPIPRVTSIAREGNVVYLGRRTDARFMIIDVTDPAHPAVTDSVSVTGYVECVKVSDGKLFVVDRYQGLRIYSLADPFSPVQIGLLSLGQASKLAVYGNCAILQNQATGTHYVDITDPTHPVQRGLFPGYSLLFEKMVTDGRYAYVIYDGMRVYDMINPDNIIEVGGLPYPWPKANGAPEATLAESGTGEGSMILDGNYLWLFSSGGLGLYDIRNRVKPTSIIGYSSSSSGGAGVLDQNRIYMAQESGLTTLEYTKCCNGMTGDLNMDGHIDLSDLSLTILYVLYRGQTTSICGPAVDIDGSGNVDLTDLSMSIAYVTGAIPSLPNCQ
ncbi:MAG: hypothetical protein IPH75_08650 [bacterium]|nr:hypothetical protein [bacterium]